MSYKGHPYPAEIIAHCVWLYHRFPLSFREVEELMLVRGVIVTHGTIPDRAYLADGITASWLVLRVTDLAHGRAVSVEAGGGVS